jgi:hypothetical protein
MLPAMSPVPVNPVIHPDPLVFDQWAALQSLQSADAKGQAEASGSRPLHEFLDFWRAGRLPLKETRRRLDVLLSLFGLAGDQEDDLILACLTGESKGYANIAPTRAGHSLIQALAPFQPGLVGAHGFSPLLQIMGRSPPRMAGMVQKTVALVLAHAKPAERTRCLQSQSDGESFFTWAAIGGMTGVLAHLVDEYQVPVGIRGGLGMTALEQGLIRGHVGVLRCLVLRGARPDMSALRWPMARVGWHFADFLKLGPTELLPLLALDFTRLPGARFRILWSTVMDRPDARAVFDLMLWRRAHVLTSVKDERLVHLVQTVPRHWWSDPIKPPVPSNLFPACLVDELIREKPVVGQSVIALFPPVLRSALEQTALSGTLPKALSAQRISRL